MLGGFGGEFLGDERGVIQDHGEQVVEIVGDPAGELPQNLQALALVQLGLQLFPVDSVLGAFLAHPMVEPVLSLLDLDPLQSAFRTDPLLEPVLCQLYLDLLLGAFLTHPDLEPVLGLLDLDHLLGTFVAHDDLEAVLSVGHLHPLVRVFGVDMRLESAVLPIQATLTRIVDGLPTGIHHLRAADAAAACAADRMRDDHDRGDDVGGVEDRREGQHHGHHGPVTAQPLRPVTPRILTRRDTPQDQRFGFSQLWRNEDLRVDTDKISHAIAIQQGRRLIAVSDQTGTGNGDNRAAGRVDDRAQVHPVRLDLHRTRCSRQRAHHPGR
ncbi:MAG TPA: hypothetical protein VFG35_17245 [Actinoplanes sp.]|nr:hypothetical protein [Actinoplanes sp.]